MGTLASTYERSSFPSNLHSAENRAG